jgi:hypothetical protein
MSEERPAYKEETQGNKRITTFKIGEPEEQILIQQVHIQGLKICLDCKKPFKPNSNNQDYCMDCRKIKWNNYMRERMAEDRLMMKLSSYTDDQVKIFEDLIKKQQFIEDIPVINEHCLICNSTENLLEHHISYVPEIKIIMCKKCHIFFHNMLLHKRKCRPIRIK